MVNVPSEFVPLLQQMSSATGIPYAVEAAQANEESGFNPNAVSSTGAEGWLQFEPSTYNAVAAQAGVAPGSEFDPASEAKAYDVYMTQLLQQEGGNLRNALAAYNAGPGNLSAGYAYADAIMATAGQAPTTVDSATTPNTASTAGFTLPFIGSISVGAVVKDAINGLLSALGIKSTLENDLKEILERFGLIVLGFALVLLGIKLLAGGSTVKNPVQTSSSQNVSSDEEGNVTYEERSSRKVNTPVSRHERTTSRRTKIAGESEGAAKSVGADEAIEAAAIA